MSTLKRRAMHLSLLGGLAIGALAALPATGHAAAAGTSSASVRAVSGGLLQLDYTGSADANRVLITLEPGTDVLRISDSVTITPGAGCVPAPGDLTTVRCSAGITRILARLGEGADRFTSLVPLQGYVEGDGGDDVFRPGQSKGTVGAATSRILYSGGPGEDTADYQGVPATGPNGNDGVRVSLDFRHNDGREADGARPADEDNVQTENVVGGSFGDTLTGDDLNNRLTGGNGVDTLSAGRGNDVIDLRDGTGDLRSSCGEGTDVAVVDAGARDNVNLDCETVQRP
jgi:Ca2+-binding RTX toxin-like protein